MRLPDGGHLLLLLLSDLQILDGRADVLEGGLAAPALSQLHLGDQAQRLREKIIISRGMISL